MAVIRSKYAPRRHFFTFHQRRHRWSILVAHRRAGKTVAVINDMIERATYNTRENPRYAYVAPLLRQAKDLAWTYLQAFAAPFSPKINQSELWVELTAIPSCPRITLYGADNPDSFRGMYFDGVALDEFGNMRESVWKEVLLPALADRRGWAVFMGTPNGPNHFRDMYYRRKDDEKWFTALVSVKDTTVFSAEDLGEMQDIMDPEQFAQEMYCSFEASVRGAIYARQMEAMGERIGPYAFDKNIEVDLVMDLGFRDDTAMGFCQQRFDGLLMGHAHADNMKPIAHYINYAERYWADNSLRPGTIWLPHDARARTLQTGKSIIETFRPKYRPRIVPQLDLLDGIAATRATFPVWYINEPECQDLVMALKSYHRQYDEEKKVYSDAPVHDWSSHYADMWRYASIVKNPKAVDELRSEARFEQRNLQKSLVSSGLQQVNYAATLEDMFEQQQQSNSQSFSLRRTRY